MTKSDFRVALSHIERYTCLIFTSHITLLTILNAIEGVAAMSVLGIFMCLAIDFGMSVLSYIAFSDLVIKRVPIAVRYVICYLGLVAVGFALGWFDTVKSTLVSVAIAAAIQLFIVFSNSARTKLYNARLREYQQRHGDDE
ncbi:MAG: hypothetical protein Q4C04_07845 [Clostridia bacterium]|nr:hypothetical protein [Clostridia bacterium]